MTTTEKKALSPQHLANLAAGRTQSAVVNRYLRALETATPKRGRQVDRSPARIEALRQEIEHSTGVQKLAAAQKLVDIQRAEPAKNELPALEAEFIKVALDYSEGHGISYTAWRQVGVSAKTLKAAGITT